MSLVKVVDSGGHPATVLDIDGYFMANFLPDNPDLVSTFRTLPDRKARDDDIIMCAFPKSGTHWIWEVASLLYKGNANLLDVGKASGMIEEKSEQVLESIPSPRILNTHLPFDRLPKDHIRKKCKIIYVLRNPKDIAVSHYNHLYGMAKLYNYHGTWDSYLPTFLHKGVDFGNWFTYVREWEKVMEEHRDLPIHAMHYEDMKERPYEEVCRLADFLDIKHDETLFRAIVDACDFQNMAVEKTKDTSQRWKEVWRGGIDGMYRKGQVGDWKNWFTVAQNEMCDRFYEEKMRDSKLKLRFTL